MWAWTSVSSERPRHIDVPSNHGDSELHFWIKGKTAGCWGPWGSAPASLTDIEHRFHGDNVKHVSQRHVWSTAALAPRLGHLAGLWFARMVALAAGFPSLELRITKLWQRYHLGASKCLCFGYMSVFTMWLYKHIYVAVPSLWTTDVYGLSPWIYEWSVTVLCPLTPAEVLLHRVYLFSQTNFILLFPFTESRRSRVKQFCEFYLTPVQ